MTWWKAATTEPGHLFGRLASDRDSKGPLLRGCREFKRLACIVTLRKFPRAFQSREPPGQHRPRASLRRPVKPGDGDPEEMTGLSLPRSAE